MFSSSLQLINKMLGSHGILQYSEFEVKRIIIYGMTRGSNSLQYLVIKLNQTSLSITNASTEILIKGLNFVSEFLLLQSYSIY